MANRRAKKLRIIGIVVLVLGMAGAGVIYWLGTRTADVSDDLSMIAYNKPERQQMERMYGKWGDVTGDLTDDLKQPGTQAIIVAAVTGLVAWGCFFAAERLDDEDEPL